MGIENKFNYSDTFYRDLTVCVLATLEDKIKWLNRFSDTTKEVVVPFYYSMSGDERFLLDTFTDDIVSDNRKSELNTDIIPRGHITLSSTTIKSDAFANPNVFVRRILENNDEMRRVLTRMRAIPIKVSYDLTILLDSEIDVFKAQQSIMNTMWIYKYMYFEYGYMNIDAYLQVPDDNQITISRENNLSSDNSIKLQLSFDVHTYYPAYDEKQIVEKPIGVNWNLGMHFANVPFLQTDILNSTYSLTQSSN